MIDNSKSVPKRDDDVRGAEGLMACTTALEAVIKVVEELRPGDPRIATAREELDKAKQQANQINRGALKRFMKQDPRMIGPQ